MQSVCFVSNYLHYSGALQVFRNLASEYKKLGIRTAYLYHRHREGDIVPDTSMFDEVGFVDDSLYSEDREGLGAALAQFANRYEIVHTSLIPLQWRMFFKRLVTRPMVETYHSVDGWKWAWTQYKYRLDSGDEKPADATIAISKGLAARIKQDSGIDAQCIYNGVRVPSCYVPVGRYVTYCGRIAHDKGLADWIKVAVRVRDRLPETKFQWVGELSPGYNEHEFRVMLAAMPWLEVTGYKEDPSPYYKKSGCILMTSPSEGLPMCIVEGMAHGVTSVSYDVGDTKETSAILARNVEQAVDFVCHVLKSRLGCPKCNHIIAHQQFSIERMAQQYLEVYEKCNASRSSFATA